MAAKLAHFRLVATVECRHCHCPIGRFRLAFASGKRKQLPHLFSQLDALRHSILGSISVSVPAAISTAPHFHSPTASHFPAARSFLLGGDIFRIAVYHKLFHWGVFSTSPISFWPGPNHLLVRQFAIVYSCALPSLFQFSRFSSAPVCVSVFPAPRVLVCAYL